MTHGEARTRLVESVTKLERPEDLLKSILVLMAPALTRSDYRILAASVPSYTSRMPDTFAKAQGVDQPEATLERIGNELIGLGPGWSRLRNRQARLERRLRKLRAKRGNVGSILRLAQFAEVGFAMDLDPVMLEFSEPGSLCFTAYMTARNAQRSLFTNGPQATAFDTNAEILLKYVRGDWFHVANVFPRANVLSNLTQDELKKLLNRAASMMDELSERLREQAVEQDLDLMNMVVQRGNDSSTWNALAGAWNKARDYWFAALEGLDWLWMLENYCPGKVLRVMAADVVKWHRASGGDVHPDTKVWYELPLPWQVTHASAICTRGMVEAACQAAGVDPLKSGWTGPRPRTEIGRFQATPELVHGVVVSNPELAEFLRRVGVFSGKRIKAGAGLAGLDDDVAAIREDHQLAQEERTGNFSLHTNSPEFFR